MAKNIGVIDDGSEKIDGVDDGEVGPKTIHSRVVGGFRSDQHVDVVKLRQAVQNLHEIGGAELGSSTRGLDRLGQTDCFTFPELHRKSTLIVLVVHFNARVVFWIIHELMVKPPVFVGGGFETRPYSLVHCVHALPMTRIVRLFPSGRRRFEASNIADSDGESLAVEIFQKGNRVLAAGADKVAK